MGVMCGENVVVNKSNCVSKAEMTQSGRTLAKVLHTKHKHCTAHTRLQGARPHCCPRHPPCNLRNLRNLPPLPEPLSLNTHYYSTPLPVA